MCHLACVKTREDMFGLIYIIKNISLSSNLDLEKLLLVWQLCKISVNVNIFDKFNIYLEFSRWRNRVLLIKWSKVIFIFQFKSDI